LGTAELNFHQLTRGSGWGTLRFLFIQDFIMANTPSAAKRARQSGQRALVNRRIMTSVKNHLKAVRAALSTGDKAQAQAAAVACESTLDKAVKTGNVHRNKANRHKSALTLALAAKQ
jgi:small subunit ribosomal protein S20